jgi:DNA invertase Pin-like site-specific DNA recombinase
MSNQQIGYIRVSTSDQTTLRQLQDIKLDKVFEDCYGAMKCAEREGLQECLKYLRPGDTLHIHSIDRLARSLRDLQNIVDGLIKNGVTIVFHTEGLVFNGNDSPMSIMILQVMGAFAEFERAITRARQREGIDAAIAAGTFKGRPNKWHLSEKVKLMRKEGIKMHEIANALNMSTKTAYTLLKRE